MDKRMKMIRLISLIIVVVMLLGTIGSLILSAAQAEGVPKESNRYIIEVELLEDAQALRVSQRLVYTNHTGEALDCVEFAVYGNMLRRESALMYENEALILAFADGYAPGGLDFSSVTVDGQAVDWGMVGENELFMRVACDLASGERAEFGFEYTLLITRNGGFCGVGDTDWHLSGFYPQALKWENGEFVASKPIQHAQYIFADRADYEFSVTMPARYLLAAPGVQTEQENGDGTVTRSVVAEGLRAFSISLGMRWREQSASTQLRTTVRVLSNLRTGSNAAMDTALEALNFYESSFGKLTQDVAIVQSDYALESLPLEGVIWISEDTMKDADACSTAIRRGLAKQFFGYAAYTMPTEDAWLSDSICAYTAYLALEDAEGHEAFLTRINRDLLSYVQYTIPGGLEITNSAMLFSADEYEAIVERRGALVFHELRNAMGLSEMLIGLRNFYEMGQASDVLGEYDLIAALDAATESSWEDFLTDWLFNIDSYYNEYVDRIE